MTKKKSNKIYDGVTTVRQLKEMFNMPTEFMFGIKPEVPLQCEFINEIISDIDDIKNNLEQIVLSDSLNKNERQLLGGVLYTLSTLEDKLEDRRTAIENLREGSENWKHLAFDAMDATKNPSQFLKIV